MMRTGSFITVGILLLLLLQQNTLVVLAAQALPIPLPYPQPDGTETPPLYHHGNGFYNWLSDAKGYTIIQDDHRWYVYADKVDGNLVSTNIRVGRGINPKKLGLVPFLDVDPDKRGEAWQLHTNGATKTEERSLLQNPDISLCSYGGTKEQPCRVDGLVVLVRFADHADRILPDSSQYDILFNHNGAHAGICPSGSVSDAFLENSYHSFVWRNTVTDWVTVSKTESYVVANNHGITTQSRVAWAEALEILDTMTTINFQDFDDDNDGIFDSISFLHSGSGAEAKHQDCETEEYDSGRVWSHQLTGGIGYEGGGVSVGRYYVASAVWGYCPPGGKDTAWDIARIGVMAHEGGHVLGLPDLYDTNEYGSGVGNFDLMSSLWGWYPGGPNAQYYPPLLGAWSKSKLGWASITHVNGNLNVQLWKACEYSQVLMIDHNMIDGEYFLLEYRFPCDLDIELSHHSDWRRDRAGGALWHVDESRNLNINHDTQGIPSGGQSMQHYVAALVQSDGQFNLEKWPLIQNGGSGNSGDSHDLFMDMQWYNELKGYKIDNSGVTLCNRVTHYSEPNTKGYGTGTQYDTGISITFGGYADSIEVTIALTGAGPHVDRPPTAPPTAPPTPLPVTTDFPSIPLVPSGMPSKSLAPSGMPSKSLPPSGMPSEFFAPSGIPSKTSTPSTPPMPSNMPSLLPSWLPSESLMPSSTPSRSPVPSSSLAPSNIPSKSSSPSISVLPSKESWYTDLYGWIDYSDVSSYNVQLGLLEIPIRCQSAPENLRVTYVVDATMMRQSPCIDLTQDETLFCRLLDINSANTKNGLKPRLWQLCPIECPTYSGCAGTYE